MSSSDSQNPAAATTSSEAQEDPLGGNYGDVPLVELYDTLSVDPALTLSVAKNSGGSAILRAAFNRYRGIVFKNIVGVGFSFIRKLREQLVSSVLAFDVGTLKITFHSDHEELQFGVDESYTLLVPKAKESSQN
ncbi:hypothetical protein JHK82_043577 [Glycine max]|nr:hypothetical protein JHK82_043577 [Glycine max]